MPRDLTESQLTHTQRLLLLRHFSKMFVAACLSVSVCAACMYVQAASPNTQRSSAQARLHSLLAQREVALQAEAQSKERQVQALAQAQMAAQAEAHRRELADIQSQLEAQVRQMEATWKQQLAASQRALQEATNERMRMAADATVTSVQVRQQLLELQALREELSSAQTNVAALKRAAEGSKAVAQQQVRV